MPPAPSSAPATPLRRAGFSEHWGRLRRQYAVEGYLHGLGHAAASRLVPARRREGWDDRARLAEVNALAPRFASLPDAALAAESARLRETLRAGTPLAALVAEAFALVREASRRVLGLYHHDVQILGGLAMARGAVAEMATGEGKTLVQSLVAYAWALGGRGVHVATANAYLAERDQEFSAELFRFLGLRSALLPEKAPAEEKRRAYAADVTFGTGTEFGFDYLRDQLERFRVPAPRLGERFARAVLGQAPAGEATLAQRGLVHAILDEADSILIDEATTPLVISTKEDGPHRQPAPFLVARDLVARLREGEDYLPGDSAKPPRLTEAGDRRIVSGEFPVPWDELRRPWKRYVENALSARHRFHRDVHYLVHEGKVVIVDEFTGRAKAESSWRDGLHQAVEAKEGLEIQAESQSAAGISRQRFYKLYERVCGMTGTAMDSAGELWEVFRLPVEPVPRHRPSQARELPTRVFANEATKIAAVVEEIARRRAAGQPVLVGARTIGNSERLSAALAAAAIPHRVLNARQDAEEAAIVAAAGQPGTVTVATNMAGRGTHISLGEGVAERGGLHVIALELEESRRIDLQLTGRTARQGQPGSHQTFLSAEDFVIGRYLPAEAERLAASRADERGEVPAARWEPVFRRAQGLAEKSRYETRQSLLRHDDWQSETKRRL
jgi:preprotein translocase subunit SecA